MAIAVETDAEWRGLRRAMRDPEWARDPGLDYGRRPLGALLGAR